MGPIGLPGRRNGGLDRTLLPVREGRPCYFSLRPPFLSFVCYILLLCPLDIAAQPEAMMSLGQGAQLGSKGQDRVRRFRSHINPNDPPPTGTGCCGYSLVEWVPWVAAWLDR